MEIAMQFFLPLTNVFNLDNIYQVFLLNSRSFSMQHCLCMRRGS